MANTKESLIADLDSIAGSYKPEWVTAAKENADLLLEPYSLWNEALLDTAKSLSVPSSDPHKIPYLLEEQTLKGVKKDEGSKLIIGLAGPGATGKETVAKALGYPRVINTTTRTRRGYEVDGVHYHFVSEDEFHRLDSEGAFLNTVNRPGRGLYGMQKRDIEEGLAASDAVIIEESPASLFKLSELIGQSMSGSRFELVYLLPSPPILPHLAIRLAKRCLDAGDDYSSVIESTLGKRQVDEFLTVTTSGNDTQLLFVVNDSVDRARDVIAATV